MKFSCCEDCGIAKTTEKQRRAPRCHTCENKRRAKHKIYHECPLCGSPKTRGRSDRALCNSCAAIERWQSDEFRDKVAESFNGEKYKVARIKKISETHRKRWADVFGVDSWHDIPREYDGFTDAIKKLVRARHGHMCAVCGKTSSGRALDVHHIDYDKKNSDPLNLVPLCRSCHLRTNYHRDFYFMMLSSYMANVPTEMMRWVRAVI